jgi:hypothetical protein
LWDCLKANSTQKISLPGLNIHNFNDFFLSDETQMLHI